MSQLSYSRFTFFFEKPPHSRHLVPIAVFPPERESMCVRVCVCVYERERESVCVCHKQANLRDQGLRTHFE